MHEISMSTFTVRPTYRATLPEIDKIHLFSCPRVNGLELTSGRQNFADMVFGVGSHNLIFNRRFTKRISDPIRF